MHRPISLGIFLFDEVEVLDFAGPFEVFSRAYDPKTNEPLFSIATIAERATRIRATGGLEVCPSHCFATAPYLDVLLVPGGMGARELELHNAAVLSWVKDCAHKAAIVASVCTGAFILAEAGLLSGKRVTTHWASFQRFEDQYPDVSLVTNVKFVDEGKIMTSAGISAGINLALHIVEKLVSSEVAQSVAKRMEYDV